MEQKRVLITICGRAGSKGFKNKNLKIFDGHPLSYYSLSAAELFIRSRPDLAVDVCLNTDSGLLIDVITKKYPEVTVLPRPEELCGDDGERGGHESIVAQYLTYVEEAAQNASTTYVEGR